MSEANPFRSYTVRVDKYDDIDQEVEAGLQKYTSDGYTLVSGPNITEASTGRIWVNLLFHREEKPETDSKVYVGRLNRGL